MSNEMISGLAKLQAIGADLDIGVFPVVFDGGEVEPNPSSRKVLGERRISDESERPRGSPAGSGTRAAGWARPAGGSAATSSTAAPFIRGELLNRVEQQIVDEAAGAYQQVSVRPSAQVMWLSMVVQPIRGLPDKAFMTTSYPRDPRRRVSTWAWWTSGVWVGPRHTNYPDGSICSYDVADDTWSRRNSLVALIDLNIVWVARHLHLRYFDRWPGRQVLHTSFERLTEHRPAEYCGCDSGCRYEECCREKDLGKWSFDRHGEFSRVFRTAVRGPPESILKWMLRSDGTEPPLDEVAPFMATMQKA